MRRNIILGGSIVFFLLVGWFNMNFIYGDKSDLILDLQVESKKVNEKLITSQILANKLDRVYKVFEYNLATNVSDKKNEEASIDFLDELTDIIDRLEIKLINIVPDDKQKVGKYTYIPYDIELNCDYEKFGKFIAELEKDSRLINIDEFRLFNKIEKASSKKSLEALLNNKVELTISTITLNKVRG